MQLFPSNAEEQEGEIDTKRLAITRRLMVAWPLKDPATTYLWLARNEGMDPYSSPCITHCLFHSFLPG